MIIRIDVEALKKAVEDLLPIMKGNSLPILDNLLITAEGSAIVLSANNLSIKIDKRLEGEILSEGKALLHRDDLSLLLKMKNDVELEFAENQCTVKGSRIFKFNVCEDADDFPSMQEVIEGEPDFAIPESTLLYSLKLKKIIAGAGQDKLRGLWIDGGNILACDGYRLAKIETQFQSSMRFMLPDFVLNYLAKALDKKSSELIVFYLSDRGYVKACSDSFEITFRQYDGEFVSYENMFNLDGVKTIVLQKQVLADAIGFICDIGKSGGKKKIKAPVVYSFDKNRLRLAYNTANRQVEEEIQYTGQDADIDMKIGFDPYFVNDLLSLTNGEHITMSVDKPLTPSIMYGENESEKYLLLPVRVSNAA